MDVKQRVDTELADAMRARDGIRLSALRLLKTALTNRSVEKRRDLDDAEAIQVVQAIARQRHDSIEQFTKAGRLDLVEKERAELEVLERYLPPAMDAGTLSSAIDAVIADLGATSPKDLGRVMKAVMARLAGQSVDGKTVSDLVRTKLAGR